MDSSEAGASSGSEYQVFLSFRGPDTRSGFTNCLYHSLLNAGIYVFQDDEELRVGERIDGALERGINNSRIYIPIFSQNYASSKWCLRELAQIVENTSSNGNKEILPIFFDVKPDDVKLKTSLYRNAIVNLEREKNLSTKQVDSWREALEKVDAIKGWEAKKYKGAGELIKLVVEEVVKKLKIKQKFVTEHLIGIDDQVAAVKDLLNIDSGGGQVIQIHGMGGIGKTTLAKVVYNQLSTDFGQCCCFLEDFRGKSSRADGLVELQKKLLSEIGNATGIGSIDATDYGRKRIEETLRLKKVFIVLDDVDKSEQVDNLVGKGALCAGSRVLITTRNKDVLQITKPAYEMKVMSSDHALQLFSRHAFNKDSPSDDHHEISKDIVSVTGSLPLTIAVIGSFLNNKTQDLWKETLHKLCKAPPQGVFEVLKISYDALDFEQQQIFLDIACFFIGEKKTKPIYMWTDCGFFPISGIEVLKNRSLIKIGENDKFLMHDQLRDLGRGIVCKENPTNPELRSRLWNKKEVLNTIRTKKTENNVQAMKLHFRDVFRIGDIIDDRIRSEEIRKFENLRFLTLNDGTFVGDLTDCFSELRWIFWRYPLRMDKPTEPTNMRLDKPTEPTNMRLNNVVILEFSLMPFIDDRKLWNLIKEARKLKVLTLQSCDGITRTPNLSGCSNLERLSFDGCTDLKKIDSSIGKLKYLKELKFDYCFFLEGLPEEIGDLQNLEILSLLGCDKIKELPNFIFKCKSLRDLHFSDLGPTELSGEIGKLENLEVLWVDAKLKGQLPSEIGLLSRLQRLVLRVRYEECMLRPLSQMLTHQEVSSALLKVIPDLSNLTNLVELDLHDGSKFWEQNGVLHTGDLKWIGRLSKLEFLRLCLFNVPAPTELASLPQLNIVQFCGLNLQPLVQVRSSLLEPSLDKFNSIVLLSSKNLSSLELSHLQMQEIQLDGPQLPNLTALYLVECEPLERFMLPSMRKLKRSTIHVCPKLEEIYIAGLLESLEELTIFGCKSFRGFVYVDVHWESPHESSLILASRVFSKLWRLHLENLTSMLSIQVVDTWESLKYLTIKNCGHLQSLGDLSNLKNLEFLEISLVRELRIVKGLDELKCLNRLRLWDCGLSESSIDRSTTKLPNDCRLLISSCPELIGVYRDFKGTVQSFKHYTEEESVPTASTDPLMVWRAKSSAQERMRVPGTMEELQAPFEEPQEPSSHGTCTCFGGLFFFWSKFGGLFCFKDH